MAKLLRKDVLKWIRNLKSGQYKKGTGYLVDATGTKFCCLGVWADQHGAVWEEESGVLIPKPSNNSKRYPQQSTGVLNDPRLIHGLTANEQADLASLNDNENFRGWDEIIRHIKEKVLRRAK